MSAIVWTDDYAGALQRAAATGRPLLVFLWSAQ